MRGTQQACEQQIRYAQRMVQWSEFGRGWQVVNQYRVISGLIKKFNLTESKAKAILAHAIRTRIRELKEQGKFDSQ